MSAGARRRILDHMDLIQIVSAVAIIGGVVVTALIAIVPSVVNR